MQLVGVNSTGFQNIADSYDKLIKWAAPKGLLSGPSTKMATIYHDSARTTAHDKVRTSACLLVNEPLEVEGEISLLTIKPNRCIVAAMEITMTEFELAWKGLYIWMNNNDHRPSAANPFEIYHNNYQEHPEKKCIVDFCIPIE